MIKYQKNSRVSVTKLLHTDTKDMLDKVFTLNEAIGTTGGWDTLERDVNGHQYVLHESQIELKSEPTQDFTKSFKFTVPDCSLNEFVYTYSPPTDGDRCQIDWAEDEFGGTTYSLWSVKQYVAEGSWKIVPEGILTNEKCLPDTFTFYTRFGDELCTAKKSYEDFYYVTWSDTNFTTKSEAELKESLEKGDYWLAEPLVPTISTNVPKYATGGIVPEGEPMLVGEHTSGYFIPQLNIDGSTSHLTTLNEEASEICLPQACSFLNSIKAFSEEFPASVFIDSGKYIIYYEESELFAETDLELWDVMQSVKCLKKAAKNGN